MKKHIVSIRTGSQTAYFMVSGDFDKDGKFRLARSTYNEIFKRSNITRGHAFVTG